MKTFLHVGCGPQRKSGTTRGFNNDDWCEVRLDIDTSVAPDIVGTMVDMPAVESGSMDALFSSHNIEHLYPHEVPIALAEFFRVLKTDGFVVLTCPDLQSVCELVSKGKLVQPAYYTGDGLPISPIDILYGWRQAIARGNLYMAHRCGFTADVLRGTFELAGFRTVAVLSRPACFDLWALASKTSQSEEDIRALAAEHFMRP